MVNKKIFGKDIHPMLSSKMKLYLVWLYAGEIVVILSKHGGADGLFSDIAAFAAVYTYVMWSKLMKFARTHTARERETSH